MTIKIYTTEKPLTIWRVDFNNYENTDTPVVFDGLDINNFIDNLNDWD